MLLLSESSDSEENSVTNWQMENDSHYEKGIQNTERE